MTVTPAATDRDYPQVLAETDHVEPAPRRMRATLGGEQTFDTIRARLYGNGRTTPVVHPGRGRAPWSAHPGRPQPAEQARHIRGACAADRQGPAARRGPAAHRLARPG